MRAILRLTAAVAVAISIAPAASGPAHALTMRKAEFTCPIGGEKFTANVVGSYTQFGTRLDLRPVGAMLSPVPMPVCPGNGFVMFQREFTPEDLKSLEPIVLSDEYRAARRDHTDYYMVAFMRSRLGAKPIELARLYHRASWEAEGRYASEAGAAPQKPALVQQYRALALQNFDAFLKEDQSHSAEWWTAAAIAAELERLLGRFDAVKARIARLPVGTLPADSAVRRAIDQIGGFAVQRNSEPQKFVAR